MARSSRNSCLRSNFARLAARIRVSCSGSSLSRLHLPSISFSYAHCNLQGWEMRAWTLSHTARSRLSVDTVHVFVQSRGSEL